MSELRRLVVAALFLAAPAPAAAQTVAEYRARLDSLVAEWRPLIAAEDSARMRARATANLPHDSARVVNIIVRADSGYIAMATDAAARLAPRVERAYGAFSETLLRHQFVLKARVGPTGNVSLTSAVADSLGDISQRSGVLITTAALEGSWAQKVEQVITESQDAAVRQWLSSAIPIDPMDRAAWRQARIELLLAPSTAARACVADDLARCVQVLELTHVDEPAFIYLTPSERRQLVLANARIIRRSDAAAFDRCSRDQSQSVCDDLARLIPSDAVPRPVPGVVRQSFLRFALARGGTGAFDRFATTPGDIRGRITAAAGQPIDTLVAAWRATLLDARTNSTAIDGTTAASSLFWIGLCACLAMRSSRWR